jgi:invasion protein IalB
MSGEFSNFGRQPAQPGNARANLGGGTSLYLVFGGAVVVAAATGALIAFMLKRSPGGAQQSLPVNPPNATQAAAAQGNAAAPAEPQWSKVATYGSWEVRCQNPSASTKVCAAWLEIVNQQNKQVMMAWIVGPDNKGALQTIFQTPTGVRVAAGLDLKLGNAAARHVNYINCLPRQCTAGVAMDDAFVKDTIAAQKADVTLYAPDGKGINFGIPVTGFDKAVAAIKTSASAK